MLLLEYNQSILVDDQEPNSFHKYIEGAIRLSSFEGTKVRVGSFSIIVIDVEAAVNAKVGMFDMFDCSSRTVDYFDLYTGDMDFAPNVIEALGGEDRWTPNMLILERLELLPKFRGREIGLRVLRWLQFHFGTGCGIVAIKPYPLQFEGGSPDENKDKPDFVKMGWGQFGDSFEVSLSKLLQYYGRLGFNAVTGTPFMVADPIRPLHTLEMLGLQV